MRQQNRAMVVVAILALVMGSLVKAYEPLWQITEVPDGGFSFFSKAVDPDNGDIYFQLHPYKPHIYRYDKCGNYICQYGNWSTGGVYIVSDMAVRDGLLYAADRFNKRVLIFDTDSCGWEPPIGVITTTENTGGLAVDSAGNVYVMGDDRMMYTFDNTGAPTGSWGPIHYDPIGVTIDASDNIFVAVWGSWQIRKFDTSGTLLGQFGPGYPPIDVAVDGAGNIYAAITYLYEVRVFDSSFAQIDTIGVEGCGAGEFCSVYNNYWWEYGLRGVDVTPDGDVYTGENCYQCGFDKGRVQKFVAANGPTCSELASDILAELCTRLSSSPAPSRQGLLSALQGVVDDLMSPPPHCDLTPEECAASLLAQVIGTP